ncbi:MAG TPA: hypothetical protein VGH77_08150, partial [Streptosporangiaceae bacterium]
ALRDELAGYPSPPPAPHPDTRAILVPLRLRVPGAVRSDTVPPDTVLSDTVLSLFSTTTVFGTPRDVTLSELAIESFYPADAATASYLSGSAGCHT